MNSLEDRSLSVAVFVPFQKSRGMLKFLRNCINSGKIGEDKREAFKEVFAQSVNNIDRKWPWSNWRVCKETDLINNLTEFAWTLFTSKDSLIGVLLSQIMPVWNGYVKDKKLTFTVDRLLLYTKCIASTSTIFESCSIFLKMEDSMKLDNRASFTFLPWERVMFSCLLIIELAAEATAAAAEATDVANSVVQSIEIDRYILLVENEKLSLTLKFVMAAICGSVSVLDRLWKCDREMTLTKICNKLSLYLTQKSETESIVRWLVSHGVSATCRNSDGSTLLHLASKAGYKKLIEDLLTKETGIDIDAFNNSGKTPLHKAAEGGHWEIIQMFKDMGANIDKQNKGGYTPLLLAVENCEIKAVEALLALGANADLKNQSGDKPIQVAINKRYVDIIRILLDKGSSVNSENSIGETCLHAAILHSDIELVKILIDKNCDLNKTRMSERSCNETPLHIACQRGVLEAVQLILESGGNATLTNSKERTALHEACWNGHHAIAKLLLFKYNRRFTNYRDYMGKTALHLAAEFNEDKSIVALLLEKGADASLQSKKEETALMLASKKGKLEIVEQLLSKNSQGSLELQDENGKTALLIASEFNTDESVVSFLISKDADINMVSKFKETSLMLAAKQGNLKILEVLLKHNVQLLHCSDQNGKTALHYAAEFNKDKSLVSNLLDNGAEVNAIESNFGVTALMLAAKQGHVEIMELILSKCDERMLNHVDQNGKNAFHYAAEFNKDNRTVSNLLDRGVNINIISNAGETTLMLAAKQGHVEMLDFIFILSKCNEQLLNHVDQNGQTALHFAAQFNKDEHVVSYLLNKGADINIIPNSGETTLLLAAKQGHVKMMKLIMSKCNERLINHVDQSGKTALHCAAEFTKDKLVVSNLISKGADVNDVESNFGVTALMLAAKQGHVKIVELILSECKELLINHVDRNGKNALHYAVEFNKDESVASLLLKKGADVNKKSNFGVTTLMLAVRKLQIMELILTKFDKRLLNDVDQNGKTALHYATELSKDKSVVLELMEAGVNLTIPSKNKQTPLFLAASRGLKEIVTAFLGKCCKKEFLNCMDNLGRTALSYAAENRHWEIVFILANKKAAVNVDINRQKMSPLHKAVIYNNIDAVIKLLEKGADVTIKDNSEKNALNYSEELEHSEITQLLKKKMGI